MTKDILLTIDELDELGVTPYIGSTFETDRIDFVTHKYTLTRSVVRRRNPDQNRDAKLYWAVQRIEV